MHRAPLTFLSITLVTTICVCAPSWSADISNGTSTEADTGVLAEIVVTAEKRSESLQNVPIAVTAVSGNVIAEREALSLEGLEGTVPNVQINNFSNTPNSAVFSIRGIGVIDPDPYAGNTVSVVVDGVPQYFSMGALLELYDIDRVEILRGPQGTLFGANTTGGVINVITKQPTGELTAKFQAGYGNHNSVDGAGTIDFPIIKDVLAGKVTVAHTQTDGYYTNIYNGDDMGNKSHDLFRTYLKLTPTSDFDATLIEEYDRARDGSPVFVNGSVPGEAQYVPPGTQPPGALLPQYPSPCVPAGQPCRAPSTYYSADNSTPNLGNLDTHSDTLTANWRNSGAGDITSITGYKSFHVYEFTDQDGSSLFLADSRRNTLGWQLSEELRTVFKVNDIFNFIAGIFYMKDHYDHQQDYRIQFAAPGLLQTNLQDQDNHSTSAFFQGYANVTSRLRLQAGIRFTSEETSMLASTLTSINPSGITNYEGTGNVTLSDVAPPRGKKTWNNVGWKLGPDYKLTEDTLLYAYWARGFKSGVFTGRLGTVQDLGPAAPEHVDTFEGGIKTDLLDRHVRLNLAAFYTDYRDIQLATIYFQENGAETIQGNRIINAGAAKIKGFELESTVVPIDRVTLTSSLAYLDAKYSTFNYYDATTVNGVPIGNENLSGYPLQNSPEWSATAGANYEFQVGPGRVKAHALYRYTGSLYDYALNDTPRSKVQATSIVDANLDYVINAWTVGLWSTNLFDRRYISSVYDAPGTEGLVAYQPPRLFGVRFNTEF
jgi:iron complex outermembrane receptor protein